MGNWFAPKGHFSQRENIVIVSAVLMTDTKIINIKWRFNIELEIILDRKFVDNSGMLLNRL